jgi:hypothetical protein
MDENKKGMNDEKRERSLEGQEKGGLVDFAICRGL